MQERELYQNSVRSKEKPFRMFNDGNDVIMSLTKLEQGWELRQTPDNVVCLMELFILKTCVQQQLTARDLKNQNL